MYHFRVKVIGRSTGRSATGAAAYRTGGRSAASGLAYRIGGVLRDPLTGEIYDYRAKGKLDANGYGVLHTEIRAPAGASVWVFDLQELLNRVEAAEKRKDAQFFRELEISLPRELSLEDQKALLREFVDQVATQQGMAAVIAIHNERASDGGSNPHAHVLLTMRELEAAGFGKKVRAWNDRSLVSEWREAWATMANDYMASRGIERRLDHRSFRDRDIEVEPDIYVGPGRGKDFDGVIVDGRRAERAAIKERNLERALSNPDWVLEQISRMQSTFTENDIAAFLHRHTASAGMDDRFEDLKTRILGSSELMRIASDLKGPNRYTTRSLFECELRLAKSAKTLAGRGTAASGIRRVDGLTAEQEAAARYILNGPDLTALHGVAGAGKSHLIARVKAALEERGHRVRGASLSALVARNLAEDADMPTQTIASLLKDLARKRPYAPLQKGDVLVLDEAGLVGSRQMEAILRHVEAAGAKLVLVGDTRQLQAIEAGAAFRAIVQRHGAANLSEVRRQKADWQKEATKALAAGNIAEGLAMYRSHGALHAEPTEKAAMEALVAAWANARATEGSQLILTHRRADVAQLNALVRSVLSAEGSLGEDVIVPITVTEDIGGQTVEKREVRLFAKGDRILFTRNDRDLGVENGTVATVTDIDAFGRLEVLFADGRKAPIDLLSYSHLEQGYALTLHKSQGVTVDKAFVYASNSFDAHLTYVAMSRHRESVNLYYGRNRFSDDGKFVDVMSRVQSKDTTLDYAAQRDAERGVDLPSLRQQSEAGPPASTDRLKSELEVRRERARAQVARDRVERERRVRDRGRDDGIDYD